MRDLLPGVLSLLSAAPVAYLIYIINQTFLNRPERAVMIIGVLFVILIVVPPAIYLISKRRLANPWRLGLIVVATICVLLVSVYIYWVSSYVYFPADILTWSEGDFVNDILKFRLSYPLYSAQVNNDSFTYSPGSRLLTYFLAWLSGNGTSIPFYRMIQVVYTLLAAGISMFCCRKLVDIGFPRGQSGDSKLWVFAWLPLFFLIGTNSLTNPFAHNLHDDALAQLVTAGAYWLLLEYVSTRKRLVLVLMMILPAIGFLVKQSLGVWALFYCVYLVFFDQPRSIPRIAIFTIFVFGGIGLVLGGCYILWGNHFFYWTFTVLGKHGVSPLRSFQHMLDVWPYFVIGILGGMILVRGKTFHVLLGPWLIWLFLILLEAYTSGIAWMRNHMGPGSLIAGVWFIAGLVKLWPSLTLSGKFRIQVWMRTAGAVAVIGLLFNGLGMVRIPIRALPSDAYRYINDIEKEFNGQSAKDVLLDIGSWVYIKGGVIMKDRAPSIGERGYSETGDFSGILQRLQEKHYSKILIRHLNEPDFFYDYYLWPKSSGIRKALLDNYREIRKIKGVQSNKNDQHLYYFFDDISILVPKPKRTDGSM